MKKNTVSVVVMLLAISLISSPALVYAESTASTSTETPVKKAHVTYVAVKRDPNSTSSSNDLTLAPKTEEEKVVASGTPSANTIKKTPAKATPLKKAAVKKAPVKKVVAKKAPVKKPVAKKAPAKKTATTKTPTKKTN